MEYADFNASLYQLMEPLKLYLGRIGLTDLCINKPGRIFLEVGGAWECIEDAALTLEWARALVNAAAIAEGKQTGPKMPFLSAALPYALRLQAVLPPACRSDRILLALRQARGEESEFHAVQWTEDAIPKKPRRRHPSQLAFHSGRSLKDSVRERMNIVIIGGTGAGKTAILKRLIRLTDVSDRIVTIEDVHEIALRHRNSAQLFYGEGLGISASDCLRESLRLRPERIVLSECRGAEAFDFLQILISGHRGAMTTLHADSPDHAIERLAMMARTHPAGAGLDANLARELAFRSIDMVITIRKLVRHARMAHIKCLH